jgi:hypothetical protein
VRGTANTSRVERVPLLLDPLWIRLLFSGEIQARSNDPHRAYCVAHGFVWINPLTVWAGALPLAATRGQAGRGEGQAQRVSARCSAAMMRSCVGSSR